MELSCNVVPYFLILESVLSGYLCSLGALTNWKSYTELYINSLTPYGAHLNFQIQSNIFYYYLLHFHLEHKFGIQLNTRSSDLFVLELF